MRVVAQIRGGLALLVLLAVAHFVFRSYAINITDYFYLNYALLILLAGAGLLLYANNTTRAWGFEWPRGRQELLNWALFIAVVLYKSFLAMKAPLWGDEVGQFEMHNMNFLDRAFTHGQPPLDFLLSQFSRDVFGYGIIQMRLFSLLFGILLGPVCYQLFRLLEIGPWGARIATGLILMNPEVLKYTLEARPTSIGALTFFLLLYEWVAYKKGQASPSHRFSILGVLILFVMAIGFQPVVIGLFFVLFYGYQNRFYASAYLAAMALVVPLVIQGYKRANGHFSRALLEAIDWGKLSTGSLAYFRDLSWEQVIPQIDRLQSRETAGLIFFSVLTLVWHSDRKSQWKTYLKIYGTLFSVYIFSHYLLAVFIRAWPASRYFLLCSLSLQVLLFYLFMRFLKEGQKLRFLAVVASTLVFLAWPVVTENNVAEIFGRSELSNNIQRLSAKVVPGDVVLAVCPSIGYCWDYDLMIDFMAESGLAQSRNQFMIRIQYYRYLEAIQKKKKFRLFVVFHETELGDFSDVDLSQGFNGHWTQSGQFDDDKRLNLSLEKIFANKIRLQPWAKLEVYLKAIDKLIHYQGDCQLPEFYLMKDFVNSEREAVEQFRRDYCSPGSPK